MATQHPPQRITISTRAEICRASLERLVACLDKVRGPARLVAEEQWGRFQLWASNIGVFARRHASLDYRLRDAPEVADSFAGLLKVLHAFLNRALQNIRHTDFTSNPAETSQNIVAATHGNIEEIGNTIGRLHRLSLAVRKAGSRNPFGKAAGFTILDTIDGQEIDISDEFDEYVARVVEIRAPALKENRALCDRISNAIRLRRQRFLYARAHQRKLATQETESVSPFPLVSPFSSKNDENEIVGANRGEKPETPPEQQPITAAWTETTASAFNAPSAFIPERVVSEVSSISTNSPIRTEKPCFPPPPQLPFGTTEHQCPYCCLVISEREFSITEKWNRHLEHDLEPYVCLETNCKNCDEYFRSFKDWISHMQTHSVKWVCPVPGCTEEQVTSDGPGQRPTSALFLTEADFVIHMNQIHPKAYSQNQVRILSKRSRRPALVFETCPFCGRVPEESSVENGQTSPKETEFQIHVAHHLLALFAIAFPWRDDVIEEDDDDNDEIEGNSADARHSRSKLTGKPSSYDDPSNASNSIIAISKLGRQSSLQSHGEEYASNDEARWDEIVSKFEDARKGVSGTPPPTSMFSGKQNATEDTSPGNAAVDPLEIQFKTIRDSFIATLAQVEIEEFKSTTLDDLKGAIVEIQAEMAASKRLQNLRRLDGFLEVMEQYEAAANIFLNASDFLAFIWGPAKFMLMTASTWSESFNALLDAYEEIGDHTPFLRPYQLVVKQSPELLGYIYKDVLQFHQRAFKQFRSRVWKKLFHATWKAFRVDFQAILRNLQGYRRFLDSIPNGTEEYQKMREANEAECYYRKVGEEERRRREVCTWLASADSSEYQECATEARTKHPTTGHWILQERLVRSWCDLSSQTEPCLWINGKPGAGKSTLASILIEKCFTIPQSNVAYFYCRSKDSNRNTFIGLSRSILQQLTQQNTSVLSFIYEKSSMSGRSQLDSISLTREILDVSLNVFDSLFVIIDGLDECKRVEKERISSYFLSITDSTISQIRCCFISQHDKDADKLYRRIPSLTITRQHNMQDILEYCTAMETEIANNFQLSDVDLRDMQIAKSVVACADGMFLFAKLIMENLLQQRSHADLMAEMERIPPDLDRCYTRQLHQLLYESSFPERNLAKKLLCWLLCARRPLKWQEIQGAWCLDQESIDFDRSRSLIKSPNAICGSLIEVRKDGALGLVHRTARMYLEKELGLELASETANFTRICLGYLLLPSHRIHLPADSIQRFIREGHYAFSDYAVAHWSDHVNTTLRANMDDEALVPLFDIIRNFLAVHFEGAMAVRPGENVRDEMMQAMKQAMTQANTNQVGSIQSGPEPVLAQLLFVRNVMEDMISAADANEHEQFQRLYGNKPFKCPQIQCMFFHVGFSTCSERNMHTRKHERPFLCTYPGCHATIIGFTSVVGLQKHTDEYHEPAQSKLKVPSKRVPEGAGEENQNFPWEPEHIMDDATDETVHVAKHRRK